MSKETMKLALEALEDACGNRCNAEYNPCFQREAITAIKEALAEPVAWKYDVTYNQDGTVSVELPNGDELRIVLPNQQEPYCWTWDVWVSGGKWRAEYGWKKPTEKVVNLQPLYTAPPQRKPLTDKELNLIGAQWHYNLLNKDDKAELFAFARAIEAKLKEKNT